MLLVLDLPQHNFFLVFQALQHFLALSLCIENAQQRRSSFNMSCKLDVGSQEIARKATSSVAYKTGPVFIIQSSSVRFDKVKVASALQGCQSDSMLVSWDHLKMLPRLLVLSTLSLLACGSPTIISRKEWGASSLTCRVPLSLPVPYLIIDQITSMQCHDQITCSQVVRVLQSHYVHNKGWCDVAFNFLVGNDGKVYEGVGWHVQGLQTQGYNNVSLGIAFFGSKIDQSGLVQACPPCGCCSGWSSLLTVFSSYYSHEGSRPSPAALSATEDLIFFAIQNGYLSPKYFQPFLLKEETCLVPQHSETPKKACPNITPRSAWEARETHCPQMNLPAKFVIIIHTDGGSCNESAECLVRVRDIQSFHIDKKDFCDIAYHFLVGQDGGVYEGVGWNIEGSHTYGYNDIALGIAFIGNFVEKPPNEASLEAAQNLIQCAVAKGYLTSNYLLMGHSDVSNILSPGQALYNIIKTWPHFKH
ncbi:Peptidoglycan recognition protein 3 [Apodemus speciosus]|uniref:Peptidoglycan recognition protein 3 n=1 Tax=Apodemus speciosus TaxID=105296 RepID=A0ABQ0EM01_APOSI